MKKLIYFSVIERNSFKDTIRDIHVDNMNGKSRTSSSNCFPRIVVSLITILFLLFGSGCISIVGESIYEIKDPCDRVEGPITIVLFVTEGCDFCYQVDVWLEELKAEYGDEISIEYVDVLSKEGWNEFKSYDLSVTPSVIVDESIILEFRSITKENLRESIERIKECSRGFNSCISIRGKENEENFRRFNN